MARLRSIKPEFWTSEQVMECSMNARLMFVGMWNFADDCGRLPNSPKTIKAQVFPSDDISVDTIAGMIQELSKNGLILYYTVANKDYLQITGWHHQRIDKPQPAKHPAPVNGYSKIIPRMVATEGIGEEGSREEKKDSDANASDADASVEPPIIDHRKRLFSEGLQKLAAMTGKGPDACRSFVGKCLKAASDDAVVVLGLIEEAERNQAVDPSAWIAARLKPRENPNVGRSVHEAARNQTNRAMELLQGLDQGFDQSGGLCDGTGRGPVRLISSG